MINHTNGDKQMQKRVWKLRNSYGVFLYARSTKQFLVIQNRDSHAFLFFFMIRDLRAWSTDRVLSLFRECTHDEIQRLMYYPFEELYNDLYLNHDSVKFRRQEETARYNYEYFHSRNDWKERLSKMSGSTLLWEFPKGRRDNPEESPIQCAFREMEEESGIRLVPTDAFRHVLDLSSVSNDWKKQMSIYRATHYFKYKPFIGQRVLVELLGAIIDHPIPLQYHRFPGHIRSYSLSDECLHGKWIRLDEAQYMLPRDILEVIEPVYATLQQEEDSRKPCFVECTAMTVYPHKRQLTTTPSTEKNVVVRDIQNQKAVSFVSSSASSPPSPTKAAAAIGFDSTTIITD